MEILLARHDEEWPEGMAPPEWVNPQVHRMRCLGVVGGRTAHFEADLIFIGGNPYAVFEWNDYEDGTNIPGEVVPLDMRRLHPMPDSWAPVRWMYELPIEDPRKMN